MIATNVLAIAKRLQYQGESEYSSPLSDTLLYNIDKNSSEKITAQEVPAHSIIVKIAVKIDINNSKVVRCLYYNRLIEELHEDFTSNDPYWMI